MLGIAPRVWVIVLTTKSNADSEKIRTPVVMISGGRAPAPPDRARAADGN
jgi:hypothetical protein